MTNLDKGLDHERTSTMEELRAGAKRDVLVLMALLTFGWYVWIGIASPAQGAPDKGMMILPIVIWVWGATMLLRRRSRWFDPWFAIGALALLTIGIWVFRSPEGLYGYCLLSLATLVVAGPAAGGILALASTWLCHWLLGSPQLPPLFATQTLTVGLISCSAVGFGWMLTRNLELAVHWSLKSYDEARRHLTIARQRRAEVLRLNQALKQAQERLELANASLFRTYRVAEEAERRQKQITAFVSHELRTPLNLVIGFAEMLVLSPETYPLTSLPPKARRDLNAIYQSARQVAGLVDDVLDMASFDHGELALMREPSDLWQVVVEAAALVHDYVESKGLTLELAHDADLPPVLIDRLRIRQVVLNLLVNAIRFTDRGAVTIRATRTTSGVRVAVSDTGVGIAPERLDHIFAAFTSTDSQDAMWGRGTGLGLPLSQRLVELHGGEMCAESVQGEGSTFWFSLPIQDAQVTSATASLPAISPFAPSANRPEAAVVLLDPDRNTAPRLQRWIKGYRFLPVADLAAAQATARESRAIAIVAEPDDLPAPGERAQEPFWIGCPLPSSRLWARRLGVSAYLTKPVSAERLLRELAAVCQAGSQVLVVDDDTRFLQLVTRILEASERGYVVNAAVNGSEALDAMKATLPDAVLLDLGLPGLDGRQVIAHKRADPRLAAIPVIVISAPPAEEVMAPIGERLEVFNAPGMGVEQITRMLEAVLGTLGTGGVPSGGNPSRPTDPGHQQDPDD